MMKLSKRILSIGGFALLCAAGLTFGPAALPIFKAVTWGLGISLLSNMIHFAISQPTSRVSRSQRRREDSQPIVSPTNTPTVLITSPTPAPGFSVMPPPHARTVVHTGRRVEPQGAPVTVTKVNSRVVPAAGSGATLTHVQSKVIKATPPPSTPLYPVLPIQRKDTMKKQNPQVQQVGSSFVSATPSNATQQVSSTFIPKKAASAPTPTYTPAASTVRTASPQQSSNSTTTKVGGRFVPLSSNDEVTNVKSTFVPKNS